MSAQGPVETWREDSALIVRLARPERHNALTAELLEALVERLAAARESDVRAVVLCGAGRSFSTGGDLGAFLSHSDSASALTDYAGRTVGALNTAILSLLRLSVPVIVRLHGATTGGALGLALAGDMVVMEEEAFVQPYYGAVGFAPDGGWTALLPERVGAARAMNILALNTRIYADEAQRFGIADRVVAAGQMEAQTHALAEAVASQSPGSLSAARALVWDDARVTDIERRLEREKFAFLERIARPEVIAAMRGFVGKTLGRERTM